MAEFDELMAGAEELIWDAFGTECQLIRHPGAEPVLVMVDLQRNLTPQLLGKKGRGGNGQRLSTLMLGTMAERAVPADLQRARLVVDGVPCVMTEPVPESGDIEFLLIPEAAESTGGNRSTTFFNS